MRLLMDRLYLRILCLMFVSLWFGVIAPGHQRGTIKLGGVSSEVCEPTVADPSTRQSTRPAHKPATSAIATCCPMPVATKTADGQTDPGQQPTQDPASCCAVCYLNSILDVPEKPVFVTVYAGLLAELEPLEPIGLSSLLSVLLTHIRGPPALAY